MDTGPMDTGPMDTGCRHVKVADDKWIHEQIVDILGLPELYPQLTDLFQLGHLESGELADKAENLARLLDRYAI